MSTPVAPDDERRPPEAAVLAERRSGIGRRRKVVKWRDLDELLASVRHRWDLAVLENVACGPMQPRDLVKLINQQYLRDPPLSRPVLTATVKGLEGDGLVIREQVSKIPAITWVCITPWGQEVVAAFNALHAWWAARYRLPRPGQAMRRRLAGGQLGSAGP